MIERISDGDICDFYWAFCDTESPPATEWRTTNVAKDPAPNLRSEVFDEEGEKVTVFDLPQISKNSNR